VVTQPGRRRGRGMAPKPSPVAATAMEYGIADGLILTPESAKDVSRTLILLGSFSRERMRFDGCRTIFHTAAWLL